MSDEGTVEAALREIADLAVPKALPDGAVELPSFTTIERIARDALAALRERGSSDTRLTEALEKYETAERAAVMWMERYEECARQHGDTRLTEALRALEEIKERSVCVIRGSIVSKHSGRFCAYHVASNALAAARADAPQEPA